ncbi:hypothetical protein AVEN_132142-1 [Araneus ventricosus]|uniref:Uncharacterized protein n=1 Tax=Araneus ventricosus TaxID=182803 RepID=A0A4Y2WGB1_ARAVE|nr:hypothetical protein AVEN_132142-1 [Araneus ventricosus]
MEVFVSNRVTKFRVCDTRAWAHCPGKQNPVDFLSRGINVEILLNGEIWWKGPQFLRQVDFPTDTGDLAIKELQRAEIYLVQLVQQGEFAEEVKNLRKDATVPSNSKVKSSNCLNESGILRVGGRLKYSNLSLDEKYPIALPYKNPLTLL